MRLNHFINENRNYSDPFIVDMGEDLEVKDAKTGDIVMVIGRYGYWEYDPRKGSAQCKDTDKSLSALQGKYGKDVTVVKMKDMKR